MRQLLTDSFKQGVNDRRGISLGMWGAGNSFDLERVGKVSVAFGNVEKK